MGFASFFQSYKQPEKLHICLITKKFPYPGRGDDDSYLWPIARGLAERGHEVVVLSWQNPYGRPEIRSGQVKAFFLGEGRSVSKSRFPLLALTKFMELHAEKPFHIVHGLDESALLIGKERKTLGVVVTYDVSATQMSQLFSILGMAQETAGSLLSTGTALLYKFLTTYFGSDRAILKTADGVFVATPLQKIMLERYYLYPDLKTFIVPYGMDYVETKLHAPHESERKELGLPHDGPVILTHTDMTEFTEVAHLLRAFQKFVIKKPNARLVIMGHGPLKKEIEFETLSLVLGNKVIFAGNQPREKMTEYVALADVYVNLSSRTTGFEPIMLEAMAQKKVVIGSELSPMATIISDGSDGFLVRPADVRSLTELIAAIFKAEFKSQSAGLSTTEIGEKAREKVINLFDINKMVEQMLSAFRNILRRTARTSPSIVAPRMSPEATP